MAGKDRQESTDATKNDLENNNFAKLSSEIGSRTKDSVLVVLNLPKGANIPPGATVKLGNMSSEHPTLTFADGTQLHGTFEETLGSQLILETSIENPKNAQLLGITDKSLRFDYDK